MKLYYVHIFLLVSGMDTPLDAIAVLHVMKTLANQLDEKEKPILCEELKRYADTLFHKTVQLSDLTENERILLKNTAADKLANVAAEHGYIGLLKYAYEYGYPWERRGWTYEVNDGICAIAAHYGHTDCLRYAHEHGCECPSWICELAAKRGHLECLRYLHEHGCELTDSILCSHAAWGGHTDCLRYLHENGCPWDEHVYDGDHLNCLRYAYEHGCPCENERLIEYICQSYFHT